MKLSENGDKIFMKIYIDKSYSTTRWVVELVRWDPQKEEIQSFYERHLDCFQITAFLWDKEAILRDPEKRSNVVYGGEPVWSGDFNCWQLKKLAKIGAYVDKELDKLSNKFGASRSFAELVCRVGEILKVSGYIIRRDEKRDHHLTWWHGVDGSSARAHIEWKNSQYVKELFPEKTEENAA
jgi:hypothetical protein